EVVSTLDGRWREKRAHDAEARGQSLRRWGRRTLPLVALAGVILAFFFMGQKPSATSEELPRELKPRVELFVQAWLARDVPRMKQFTAAARERAVYSWFKKNPPPRLPDGSDEGAKYATLDVEVRSVPGSENQSQVKVHVREVVSATG